MQNIYQKLERIKVSANYAFQMANTIWYLQPLVPMLRNHKMAKHHTVAYTHILAGALQSEQQWAKQPSQI